MTEPRSRGDRLLQALELWESQGHAIHWMPFPEMVHPVYAAHMTDDEWILFASWAQALGIIDAATASDIRVARETEERYATRLVCEACGNFMHPLLLDQCETCGNILCRECRAFHTAKDVF